MMPLIKASVQVADIMEELDLVELPANCRFNAHDALSIDVDVDQDEIDDNATEETAEFVPIHSEDLRDGLSALAQGEIAMARTLLGRALQEDSDACRVVEEVLR